MSEFLEVLEFTEGSEKEIVHRIPEQGSLPIKMGAQLIVRENQRAVFFRDGRALDVMGPGRHTLTTANLPILTKALSLPFGFNSPFRAEVIFVSAKVFTNLKWGTKNPIAVKDSDLGVVNLRAFGAYSMKVVQPLVFVNTLVGTRALYNTKPIEEFFREVIVSRLTDLIGETLTTIFDMPKNFDELSLMAISRIKNDFSKYGMDIKDFVISSIIPPDEVQQMIDERSGMNMMGDMDSYMKFKASRAMGEAAKGGKSGGSEASSGMGLGIGAGLGMLLPGIMSGKASVSAGMIKCPSCGSMISEKSKYCPECGEPVRIENSAKCPECGKSIDKGAKFCPSCGAAIIKKKCTACGTVIKNNEKFCPKCGKKQ